jgi:hypothetical protein
VSARCGCLLAGVEMLLAQRKHVQPDNRSHGKAAAALAGRLAAREVRDVPNAVLKRLLLPQEPKRPAVKGNTLIIP